MLASLSPFQQWTLVLVGIVILANVITVCFAYLLFTRKR